MKGIHTCKRILFIIILCLLWLPNYCDIKQDEADSQAFQTDKSVSSDSSSITNVPTKQEEEKYIENLEVSIEKMAVQPNVEYVNNLENKEVKITREEVGDMYSPEHDQLSEEIQQQIPVELDSSRLSSAEVKSEPSMKPTIIPRNSEKQDAESDDSPSIKLSGPAKVVLTSPSIEPSLTKPSLDKTIKLMETIPKTVISNTIELDITTNAKGATKMPHPIPTAAELNKQILEEGMHQQPHYDGMPSFDEWKKMMLAEQEKGGQKVPFPSPPGKKISSQKRRRNYSSYECGAKIVGSNSEAEGTSRILNELVDEYMLNPCKAKIWFVLELCESVQATQIELANFELFSSCPKEFAVYSSDNFPTRDWVLLGTFTAAEQRVLHSFELKQEGFGKFIKIELLSYYGKEHYCPLSVVRIFGTSMVDEYEEMEMEKLTSHPLISDDDLDRLDIGMEDEKSTNLFGSATDAVINIVKKAAEALGQHNPPEDSQMNDTISDPQNMSESKLCKAIDNSSNKCEDVVNVSKSDKLQTLYNFSILPSSMHQSLFRLLHRCDQCVSSRLRYYSSAQPHCRFFQAAFGPIVLQRLCDWFKEHPLVFAHESAAHSNKVPPHGDPLVPSPTKSPPPQIMVVPLDNDTSIKKLLVQGNLSLGSLNKSAVINATKTSFDMVDDSEKLLDKVQLEASIQATPTQQFVHTIAFNDSDRKLDFIESSEAVLPIVQTISEIPSRPTISIADGTLDSSDKMVIETGPIEASSTDSLAASEVFADVDEEQMKEFMSDSVSATEDISVSESVVAPTELPSTSKQMEEKISEIRSDIQGKLEPVSISGVSTAGQKESVFMRMSNRIKSLELNMSLSSQYLQELSQRYRRQMEEMQRAFNRTIGTLNDTARKAAEKDIKQQENLNSLQLQVGNLTETVEMLLSERSSVFRQMIETHICLMVIEAIIMITLMSLYVRHISSSVSQTPRVEKEQVVVSARLSKRRSSVDSCTPPVARKVEKRSASEEGLNAGEEPLIIEPLPVLLDPILKVKKKNRKRNKVQRSASHPSVQRRNSSPTSQCTANRVSHSEGCMLQNVRSKHQIHGKNPCENCNDNTCTEITATEKGRRLNGAPFQNLTNGTLPSAQEQSAKSQRVLKGKDKFSFRKFLKFQKRDSI